MLERTPRRWPAALTSAGAAVGAALVPKCPLCIAAALSACGLGVGMGAAEVFAILLRPAAALAAIATLVVVLVPLLRARTRGECPPQATRRAGPPAGSHGGPDGGCPACGGEDRTPAE